MLAGEIGHGHLKELKKMLQKRHQHMLKQVFNLYPLKVSTGKTPDVGLNELHSNGKAPVDGAGSSSSDTSTPSHQEIRPLTILGLQLLVPPLRKSSFFSDKQEIQTTATALGYVAHSVALVASYLDVLLRYPLRLGGSHSYILDPAPVEAVSSDSGSTSSVYSNPRPTAFPLFLEGQDTTRSAYAIFLLNKDIEQLLNPIGVQSLGPRHVLANLEELFRNVQSRDYIDKPDASPAS